MTHRKRQFEALRTAPSKLLQSHTMSSKTSQSSASLGSNLSHCGSPSNTPSNRQFHREKKAATRTQVVAVNPEESESGFKKANKDRMRREYHKVREVCVGCVTQLMVDKKQKQKKDKKDREARQQGQRLKEAQDRAIALEVRAKVKIQKQQEEYKALISQKEEAKLRDQRRKQEQAAQIFRQNAEEAEEAKRHLQRQKASMSVFKEQIAQQLESNRVQRTVDQEQEKRMNQSAIRNRQLVDYRLVESKKYREDLQEQIKEKEKQRQMAQQQRLSEPIVQNPHSYPADFTPQIAMVSQGLQQLKNQIEENRKTKQQRDQNQRLRKAEEAEEFKKQQLQSQRQALQHQRVQRKRYIEDLAQQVSARKEKEKRQRQRQQEAPIVERQRLQPVQTKACEQCDKVYPVNYLVPVDM